MSSSLYSNDFNSAGAAYGVDPTLLSGIAQRESNYNPGAVNNWDSNARAGHPSEGIMQYIPATFAGNARHARDANPAAWRGVSMDLHNPTAQILAAAWAIKNGHGSQWSTYKSALAGAHGGVVPGAGGAGATGSAGTPPPSASYGDPGLEFIMQGSPFAGMSYMTPAPGQGAPGGAVGSAGAPGASQGSAGVLGAARSQVGKVASEAAGFMRKNGIPFDSAWCGDFVQAAFKQAGLAPPPARSVPTLLKYAQTHGGVSHTAQSGSLAMYDWNNDGTPDHVELVDSVGKNGHTTNIGGNTSGPRGTGVYSKDRGPAMAYYYGGW